MSASIPVDLANPGQVLACLGLAELCELLLGSVTAGYEWEGRDRAGAFRLSASPEEVREVLDEVVGAEVSETRSTLYPPPKSKAKKAALLALPSGKSWVVDHWADDRAYYYHSDRDPYKLWAGMGGYPGWRLLQDTIGHARRAAVGDYHLDPWAVMCPMSSTLRLDSREGWDALSIGTSLNAIGVLCAGYPLVGALGAVGLTYARPVREDRLRYRYWVRRGMEPLALLRQQVGGREGREWSVHLRWAGTEVIGPRYIDRVHEVEGVCD